MDAAWPLVERQRHLRRVVDAAGDRGRRALVVTGPAGVGKTRLALEALRELEELGTPTRWVVATQAASGLPFAAVASLLGDVAGSSTPVELLAAARRSVVDTSAGHRLVLGVDDVHLLDDASAALVGHLGTTGAAFVLGTLRAGEAMPDAVSALLAGDEGTTLALERLSPEAVATVISGVLGGQVDSAAVHRLRRLADGNPLLLRVLLDDARDRGALARHGGVWRLAADWTPAVELPDLIGARLSSLSGPVLEAAQALALAEPLETSLLEELFPADALAALDDAGLVLPTSDRRRHQLRLVHPLYAESLRSTVPPLRARHLHRRLAGALGRTGARRTGDVLRLATWWLAAGEPGDGSSFVAASRQASALFDHALAERLARAAVQAGGGFPAAVALADALRWQGKAAEAEAALADWSDDEDPLPLLGVFGNAAAVHSGIDEQLDKLEAQLTDRRHLARVAAVRADLAFGRWRHVEALELARPLLEDPDADPDVLVMASETTAGALANVGRTTESLAVVESALALIRRGETPSAAVLQLPLQAERSFAHLVCGRLAVGRALATETYDMLLDRELAAPRAWFALLLGMADVLAGDLDAALPRLRESTLVMAEHWSAQGRHIRAWALGLLAEASALHGDLGSARTAVEEADAVLDQEVVVVPRGLGRVWTLAAGGELTSARRSVLALADAAADAGALAFEVLARHDAVRLGVTGSDLTRTADRLRELAGCVDGPLAPALASHAAAVQVADPQALGRAAEELAELGLHLRAAEAAVGAVRAWGDGPQARAAAIRARELVARCTGVASPTLALEEPAPLLTAREREVAALAADGLSSREIASRLVLSVRTVDNHLHRIFTKLGISRREDLPRR